MHIFPVLIMVTFACFAWAEFIPLEQAPFGAPENNGILRKTSPKVYLGDGPASCSGTFVSDQGHLLTALHCLQDCLSRAGALRTEVISVLHDKQWVQATLTRIDPEMALQTSCRLSISPYGTLSFRIRAAGECLPTIASNKARGELGPANRDQELDCRESDDAVLLEPERPLDTACLPMAARNPQIGEYLALVTSPGVTQLGSGDSDGVSPYASFGKVVRQDRCYQRRSHPRTGQGRGRVRFLVPPGPGMIQHTAFNVGGSSGGTLLNTAGELAGVVSDGLQLRDSVDDPIYSECPGSSSAVGIEAVHAMLNDQLGPRYLEQLQCSWRLHQ